MCLQVAALNEKSSDDESDDKSIPLLMKVVIVMMTVKKMMMKKKVHAGNGDPGVMNVEVPLMRVKLHCMLDLTSGRPLRAFQLC